MNRIEGIDTLRLLAIVAVISIHTQPFLYVDHSSLFSDILMIGINQASRFAVPFFFVVSGFFWGKKIRKGENIFKLSNSAVSRLTFLFLFWSVVYLIPFNTLQLSHEHSAGIISLLHRKVNTVLEEPFQFILEGTAGHLWFLVSLIMAIYLTAFFVLINKKILHVVFAAIFFVVGTLAGAYQITKIGIELPFNSRSGPFFSWIFFATGYFLSQYEPREEWLKTGLMVYLLGLVFNFLEAFILWWQFSVWPIHDYVFSTYLIGTGIAIVALSNHPLIPGKPFSTLGRLTFGVYLSHYIFVDLLRLADTIINHPLWELGQIFVVLISSILLVTLLNKWKITRKIIM